MMPDARSAADDDGGAPRAARHFSDADGRRWTVTEEPIPASEWTSADEDADRAGYPVGWLAFVCGSVRKRLRLFPKQWHALTDAELERLCRRARRPLACD